MKRFWPSYVFAAAAAVVAVAAVALGPAGQWVRTLQNPFAMSSRALSGAVVLQQMQQLERLETSRYQGQVIVQGETKGVLPTWMAGDRMLFVGQGEVVAGLDLSRMASGDLQAEGDRVTVKLPPAEIFHTRLDNRRSQVYDRRAGFLSGPDAELETRVRLEAEERIQSAARESGVLRTAQTNAQQTLRRQLTALGFRDVQFL